jgi:hypothetical protein
MQHGEPPFGIKHPQIALLRIYFQELRGNALPFTDS